MIKSYSVFLNDEPLDGVAIGFSTFDKLEEALDEGFYRLPLTTLDIEYKMLGRIDFVAVDEFDNTFTQSYLSISDSVIDVSKEGFYEHELVVIEYTHKLDKYLVHTETFTKPIANTSLARFSYTSIPRTLLEPIRIMQNYYVGQQIVIAQVSQAAVEDITIGNPNGFTLANALISTTIPEYASDPSIVLSSGPAVYTPQTPGNFEIRYGAVGVGTVFTFFITVIEDTKYTMYDVFEALRVNIPLSSKKRHSGTRLFQIHPSIVNKLKSIDAPQFFVQKVTLRQALNVFFEYINAISRLEKNFDGVDFLTCDEFNKFTGEYFREEMASYQTELSAEDYGTVGKMWAERSLLTDDINVASAKDVANGRFRTVRAKDIQLTDLNFTIPLEKTMYRPIKFQVMVPSVEVTYQVFDPSIGQSVNQVLVYNNLLVDLTSRFLDRELWQLKVVTVDVLGYLPLLPRTSGIGLRNNRWGNMYWNPLSNEIFVDEIVGGTAGFKRQLIDRVIREAINEQLTLVGYSIPINGRLAFRIINVDLVGDAAGANGYRNMKFQLDYLTADDPTIQVHRRDVSEFTYYAEKKFNQMDKALNFVSASKNIYGKLQRSSVPNITFERNYTDLRDVLQLGNRDALGYVIVDRVIVWHNEYLTVLYTATKEHNRYTLFKSLNQEYRQFEIPTSSQVFERREIFTDYLMIAKPGTKKYLEYQFIDTNPTPRNQIVFATDSSGLDNPQNFVDPYTLSLGWILVVGFEESYKRYLVIGVDGEIDDVDTRLNDNMIDTMIETLRDNVKIESRKITSALIRTDGFLETYPDEENAYYALMANVSSGGGKNTFDFVFGWEHNQIAGYLITSFVQGGISSYINTPVKYTDDNGVFSEFWFALLQSYNETQTFNNLTGTGATSPFNVEHNYPLIRWNTPTFNQTLFADCGSPLLSSEDYDPIVLKKDSSQSVTMQYQIAVLPYDHKDYVFFSDFFSKNLLVKEPNVEERGFGGGTKVSRNPRTFIHIYTNGTKFDDFDDDRKKDGATTILLVKDSNIFYDSGVRKRVYFGGNIDLTNATSWAIGTLNKVYVACNKNYNGFEIVKRAQKRPLLKEIGKE